MSGRRQEANTLMETRESEEEVESMERGSLEDRELVEDMLEGTGEPEPKLESNETSEPPEVCERVREERELENGDACEWLRVEREWRCFNMVVINHEDGVEETVVDGGETLVVITEASGDGGEDVRQSATSTNN